VAIESHPKERIKINGDPDISADSISTEIIKRENGIDQCTLVANDDAGKSYLATLNINDEITVEYGYPDEGIPYFKEFDGYIMELDPSFTKAGEVCRAVAYGQGYWMRQVRVNANYESISVATALKVLYYTGAVTGPDNPDISPWSYDGFSPYINELPNSPISEDSSNVVNPVVSDVYLLDVGDHLNAYIGPFTITNLLTLKNEVLTTCHLHMVAKVTAGTSCNVHFQYSHDGFISDINDFPIDETVNSFSYLNYYMNVLGQISTIKDLENLQIRFCISSYVGLTSVKISSVYLRVEEYQTETLRHILVGPNEAYGGLPFNHGLKVDYIDHILGLCDPATGALVAGTQYPVLNTDYVYGHLDTVDLGGVKFPFYDGLSALQELVKLSSAARILAGDLTGLQWIVDVNCNLLIAPINQHHVQGKDSSHYIDTNGGWNDSITHVLAVRQDMISEAFKTEICKANLVLISGVFKSPKIDDYYTDIGSLDYSDIGFECDNTGLYIATWRQYRDWIVKKILPPDDDYDVDTSADTMSYDASNAQYGNVALKMNNHKNTHVAQFVLKYPINISKFITDNGLTIAFAFKHGGYTTKQMVRLYKALTQARSEEIQAEYPSIYSSWEAVEIDWQGIDWYSYFQCNMTDNGDDNWGSQSILVTLKDLSGSAKWNQHGNITWDQAQYIGIVYTNTDYISSGVANCWIDNLVINGKVIRGAADTDKIDDYGCRMLTIKDSIAQEYSLTITDDSGPLARIALYELSRNRLNLTTGKVVVPMDVGYSYMAGQLINIKTDAWTGDGKKFRIVELRFIFSKKGAAVELSLTDDIWNSVPLNTSSEFNKIVKMTDPDYQTRTYASLKSGSDFDYLLNNILVKDYAGTWG
jgi:hypothetical protein